MDSPRQATTTLIRVWFPLLVLCSVLSFWSARHPIDIDAVVLTLKDAASQPLFSSNLALDPDPTDNFVKKANGKAKSNNPQWTKINKQKAVMKKKKEHNKSTDLASTKTEVASKPKLNNNKFNDNKKNIRLEFMHIPKAAGTSIETFGAQHGLIWGSCHFRESFCQSSFRTTTWQKYHAGKLPGCAWHLPLHDLLPLLPSPKDNPYQMLPPQFKHQQNWPVEWFAVVRDPYDRAVSAFYYWQRKQPTKQWSAVDMNQWLRQELQGVLTNPLKHCGHFRPQTDYLFNNKKQVVQHILAFENLAVEFERLMREHGIHASLPTANKRSKSAATLGVKDLEHDTIELLEKVYKKDFLLLNYTILAQRAKDN